MVGNTDPPACKAIPEPVSLSRGASGYLDACRAIAALAVMAGHCRGLYFIDNEHVKPAYANLGVKLVYGMTRLGHQSVMVFFVLSGLFISSSIFRNLRRQTWSWGTYALERGARLYVVLIPGLLLGLTWDLLGIWCFNSTGIYSSPIIPFGDGIPSAALTPAIFLGNLAFLQTRFVPVLGSNGPLWSLFNEFWYYLAFPAILMAAHYSLAPRRKALLGLALGVFALWMLGNKIEGFAVWLSGAAVALTARYLRFRDSKKIWLNAYICGSVLFFALCLIRRETSDLAVGLSFAAVVHGVAQVESINENLRNLAKRLAAFSYSLYVLHFPLLFLIRAAWLPRTRWQPDLKHLAIGICIALCVTLYAFLVAQATERHTPKVRNWMKAKLATAHDS